MKKVREESNKKRKHERKLKKKRGDNGGERELSGKLNSEEEREIKANEEGKRGKE